MATILLIEDDETLRFTIARALSKASHQVTDVDSLPEAREAFASGSFDIVLTDVNLGTESGIDFVQELRGQGYRGGIVVMTAYATVDDAVRAMKLGADDYLAKPVRLEELKIITERLLEQQRDSRHLRLYQRMRQAAQGNERPIGQSAAWLKTLELAERLAKIPVVNRTEDLGSASGGAVTTVLITGETGSGKGVLAKHLHSSSEDPKQPFVHVNCTALPATLIEGELFGHEKGAFTDAKEAREGLFEMADGGTIFLDEIGDLPMELQAKLLTVLEEGKIRRVGSAKERTIRVRVLAATNRDLEQCVADGLFREDLLYRINAFTIRLPGLRERGDDAVLIAQELTDRLRREYGMSPIKLTETARRMIAAHQWPGNVRELFNVIQRAAMLCEGNEIKPGDLAIRARPASVGPVDHHDQVVVPGELLFDFDHGPHTAEEVERLLMLQALEHTRGNVSKAARLIGMQRSSFRYRIERYGIEAQVREIVER
ncbi:MAG: sigma-54-dependent transcriptional regulator [Phycisphaerales bacterium JB052]